MSSIDETISAEQSFIQLVHKTVYLDKAYGENTAF